MFYFNYRCLYSCFFWFTSDDECLNVLTVDVNDPESIAKAEACGLSPAEPLGQIWGAENYKQ